MAKEGPKLFGHVSNHFSDLLFAFFKPFSYRIHFVIGGSFVLQTCHPKRFAGVRNEHRNRKRQN